MDAHAVLVRAGGLLGAAAAGARALPRPHLGLLAKLLLFLAAVLIPLAAVTWAISVQTLRARLTEELVARGHAIAGALAGTGGDLMLNGETRAMQGLVDRVSGLGGVTYILVEDRDGKLLAHTFRGGVPSELSGAHAGAPDRGRVRETHYVDPVTQVRRDVLDVAAPMFSGEVGAVRVGMDTAAVSAAATRAGRFLLVTFAGGAALAGVAGIAFARHIIRPVAHLARVAERVGRGDLSAAAPVSSRDEVGQLVDIFNDSIRRLRGLGLTAPERDVERRQREELQRSITRLLDTAVEIARGDLTLRGEVTPDALGSVVDAVNLIVEELGSIVAEVRHAAQRVASAAAEMTGATEQVMAGAHTQAHEAATVSRAMETSTRAARLVAAGAERSTAAAGQALGAARKGDEAVRDSRAAMQRIRAEVQVISKRIKGLGDRSLEISEIVDTIEEIASHTNLLALNAAIEAAGAGEAGLRFAVVADEIRKLAERAAKATRDIASVIHAVQGETQEAVVAMERGIREVEAGYQVTLHAEESLTEMAQLSHASAALAQEISASTREQVRGAEEVAGAMQSIAAVAVQTEQAGLQTRRTVDDLVKVADELTRALARFRLAAS